MERERERESHIAREEASDWGGAGLLFYNSPLSRELIQSKQSSSHLPFIQRVVDSLQG
jgi:hypothetical protein